MDASCERALPPRIPNPTIKGSVGNLGIARASVSSIIPFCQLEGNFEAPGFVICQARAASLVKIKAEKLDSAVAFLGDANSKSSVLTLFQRWLVLLTVSECKTHSLCLFFNLFFLFFTVYTKLSRDTFGHRALIGATSQSLSRTSPAGKDDISLHQGKRNAIT